MAAKAMGAPKTSGFSHQLNTEKALSGMALTKALDVANRANVPKDISSQVLCGTVSLTLASTAFMMLSEASEDRLHTALKSQIVNASSADRISALSQ